MRIFFLLPCLILIGMTPCLAAETTALQAVQSKVDQLLPILKSDAAQSDKRETIEKAIVGFFDFEAMAKLALSNHWKDFSEEQRRQFIELYKKLLESVYMDRILSYGGEQVTVENQTELAPDRAEVHSRIMTERGEIPLHYKLLRRNGGWLVYDLVIENVSLAKNYRSQFDSLLRNKTPDQLLETMQQKIGQHPSSP